MYRETLELVIWAFAWSNRLNEWQSAETMEAALAYMYSTA
jgi:hypothetical protein